MDVVTETISSRNLPKSLLLALILLAYLAEPHPPEVFSIDLQEVHESDQ
jgi:hypothetical protein